MRAQAWILIGLVGMGVVAQSAASAPMTKDQLIAMAAAHVDASIMRDLVARDCIDFDVDADNVAELSKVVPVPVIEAAIRCRKTASPAVPPSLPPAMPPAPATPMAPVTPARPPEPVPEPKTPAAIPAGDAMLRLRAEFISESNELSCKFQLDDAPFATVTKPAQGSFGEAVDRTKVTKEWGLIRVPAGRHTILAACDPGNKEMKVEVNLAAGSRTSVDFQETMFRGWKLRGVFSVP